MGKHFLLLSLGCCLVFSGDSVVAKLQCSLEKMTNDQYSERICNKDRPFYFKVLPDQFQDVCHSCLRDAKKVFILRGDKTECVPCVKFPDTNRNDRFYALHFVAELSYCTCSFAPVRYTSRDIGCGPRAMLPWDLAAAIKTPGCFNLSSFLMTWERQMEQNPILAPEDQNQSTFSSPAELTLDLMGRPNHANVTGILVAEASEVTSQAVGATVRTTDRTWISTTMMGERVFGAGTEVMLEITSESPQMGDTTDYEGVTETMTTNSSISYNITAQASVADDGGSGGWWWGVFFGWGVMTFVLGVMMGIRMKLWGRRMMNMG